MPEQSKNSGKIGLVLQGGGARGAYQVGALKALAEMVPEGETPFRIISGTSVGAINAACLATHAVDFHKAARELERLWRSLKTESIFDPSWRSAFGTLWRIIRTFWLGGKTNRYGWLDNRPLRDLLEKEYDRAGVEHAFRAGTLDGFCISTSCYGSGIAVTHFESALPTEPWERHRREGKWDSIHVDHLMASSALPVIFPAVKIAQSWHGDGALRLTAPLSPVIRMGAERILVIGVRDDDTMTARHVPHLQYPSAGEMVGTALDILFNDNLEMDIERVSRINRLLAKMTPEEREAERLREIALLSLQPSADLRSVAARHEHEMPRAVRRIMGIIGAARSDGRLPSYLLFEPGFINALIDLGYQDTMERRDEITRFIQDA